MDTNPALRHPGETSSSAHPEHQCKDLQQIILKSLWTWFLNPLSSFLFSLSPLQGISLLAETICQVQPDLWSWSLCQSFSWKWELRFQGMGAVPHWWVPNWNSHQGTSCPWGRSSCSPAALGLGIQWDRAHLPPSGFTLAPHWALRTACRTFTEQKALCEAKSLRCDTSKNRYNPVNINNQTKMCCLSKLGNFSLF